MLVSHPAEDEDDVLVVWIHNDSNWKEEIGHYSGMKVKGQLVEGEDPEDEESASTTAGGPRRLIMQSFVFYCFLLFFVFGV